MKNLSDIPILNKESTPEDHMELILNAFGEAWRRKYMKGQYEHGGRLWRKQCLPMLVDEVLDFVSYVAVMAPQLRRLEELVIEARDLMPDAIVENGGLDEVDDRLQRMHCLLTIGNEEGIPEEEL